MQDGCTYSNRLPLMFPSSYWSHPLLLLSSASSAYFSHTSPHSSKSQLFFRIDFIPSIPYLRDSWKYMHDVLYKRILPEIRRVQTTFQIISFNCAEINRDMTSVIRISSLIIFGPSQTGFPSDMRHREQAFLILVE